MVDADKSAADDKSAEQIHLGPVRTEARYGAACEAVPTQGVPIALRMQASLVTCPDCQRIIDSWPERGGDL